MKNLIIKNQGSHPADNKEELDEYLEEGMFSENREIWYWFNTAFYPKNREETKRRFSELQSGDNIVCQTVFLDFQQLELLGLLLMSNEIQKGLNIYILSGNLKGELSNFFKQRESSITPHTDEYDDSPELRKEFKNEMNVVIKGAMSKHNIYDLDYFLTEEDQIGQLIKYTDLNIQ